MKKLWILVACAETLFLPQLLLLNILIFKTRENFYLLWNVSRGSIFSPAVLWSHEEEWPANVISLTGAWKWQTHHNQRSCCKNWLPGVWGQRSGHRFQRVWWGTGMETDECIMDEYRIAWTVAWCLYWLWIFFGFADCWHRELKCEVIVLSLLLITIARAVVFVKI